MTSLTGLIGYPVSHSLSPRIHAYWIAEHKLDGDYKLFTTAPARLRQTILHMRKKNVGGVNITIPHKQNVIEYLDSVDDTAKKIGAVNTVVNKDGKFVGTNTDAYGFITNLREGLSGKVDGDINAYLKNVVILGAGGATRAACVALKEAGAITITLVNRSNEAAVTLASHFGIASLPWEARSEALAHATLLINTTSLGMQDYDALEIDLAKLPKDAAVHDIVYAPLETELLKNAKKNGHKIVDGLGMLLYQAQAAFEKWHGVKPAVTKALREHVLESPVA